MVARAPRKRMYRSMQGRMIDIEKLRATNEDVRAVGNMNVNARGDVLGVGGKIETPKANVIQKYYEAPKGRVDDTPTRARPTPVKKSPPAPQPVASKPTKVVPQAKKVSALKTTTKKTKKGIDAALDGIE